MIKIKLIQNFKIRYKILKIKNKFKKKKLIN